MRKPLLKVILSLLQATSSAEVRGRGSGSGSSGGVCPVLE
jgi:hypothetical protein